MSRHWQEKQVKITVAKASELDCEDYRYVKGYVNLDIPSLAVTNFREWGITHITTGLAMPDLHPKSKNLALFLCALLGAYVEREGETWDKSGDEVCKSEIHKNAVLLAQRVLRIMEGE